MTQRVLLTGAGGFAGSHCLEHLLSVTDWDVVCTDSFRHKGRTDRIAEILQHGPYEWPQRVQVISHDLTAPFTGSMIHRICPVDYIIAYASESHVDRSIEDPVAFIRNNVLVILSTLEFARYAQPKAVVVISTDEVYGPEKGGVAHPEWSPVIPSNPYSASKAAQEAIATSYWRTYSIPVVIVNCMNLIGERQDPEKFVPKVIRSVLSGAEVPIHGSPGDPGTRHYLHARNLADGVTFLLMNKPPLLFSGHGHHGPDRPDRYNIASADRLDNLTLAAMIANLAGRELHWRWEDFHGTRPGHDPHYGLDPAKITALGWKAPVPFEASLAKTVAWTIEHPSWLLDS